MGWCNTHTVTTPVFCDVCGTQFYAFQDKYLPIALKQGELAMAVDENSITTVKDGKYQLYSGCHGGLPEKKPCGRWVTINAIVDKGFFRDISDIQFMDFKDWLNS